MSMQTKVFISALFSALFVLAVPSISIPSSYESSSGRTRVSRARVNTNVEYTETKVKQLGESLELAIQLFNQSINSTPSQRLARLGDLIASMNAIIDMCSPSGEMYINLSKAIEVSEEKQKRWFEKSKDPNISGKNSERYANLARKFGSSISELHEKQLLIDITRSDFEQRVKDLAADKEFATDLIRSGEIESARFILMMDPI